MSFVLSCVDKKDAALKALQRNGFRPPVFFLFGFLEKYTRQREPLTLSVSHHFPPALYSTNRADIPPDLSVWNRARGTICKIVPLALFQPQDLLIQHHKSFLDDSVAMVMSEEVVSEPASLPHLLQEVRELVRF